MGKTIHYSESKELYEIAKKLKAKYINLVGYIDLDKIFFAYKGGDIRDDFTYEVLGLKNEWVKHTQDPHEDIKVYCIASSFDFYQKADGSLLEWIMLDCLYSIHPKMDGKIRRKDVHEFSRILDTLDDLGHAKDWRKNVHLPTLLGEETILFGLEAEDDSL
jgi:hypothetical protein